MLQVVSFMNQSANPGLCGFEVNEIADLEAQQLINQSINQGRQRQATAVTSGRY